jgi:hypothetical protein
MNLIISSDFIQILNIKRKHYTKNDYFLGIFNLLQEQKLNHRN